MLPGQYPLLDLQPASLQAAAEHLDLPQDGREAVGVGQILYRLETDKVENEVESPAAGTIRLVAAAGETYPVGTVIAEIG